MFSLGTASAKTCSHLQTSAKVGGQAYRNSLKRYKQARKKTDFEIQNYVTEFKSHWNSEAKNLFDTEPLFYCDLTGSCLERMYGGQEE